MIELFDRAYNCAHRGASGRAPENTLAALDLAARLGADMAEIDVQPTADGELVLLHDFTLDRTTDGTGPVTGRPLADLKRLDAGSWRGAAYAGERIPTLAEAIDRVRGRLALNIELKTMGPHIGFVDRLRRVIRNTGFTDHCVVTSFDHALIGELAAARPGFALGYICGGRELPAGIFRSKVDLLSLEQRLIGPAEMEFALASGLAVHAWTVNDPARMQQLLDLGVGGIITDHPDRFPAPQPGAKGEPK